MQRVVKKGGIIIRIGAFKIDDFTILFPEYNQKRINLINNSFRNFGFIIEPHIVNIEFNSVIEAKQILSRITGSRPEEINKTKFEHTVSLCFYFKK